MMLVSIVLNKHHQLTYLLLVCPLTTRGKDDWIKSATFHTCQFEHASKQIKLLPLKPKTGQLKWIFILALLPTPPCLPLIAIILSLTFTNHACPVHKPLPPLLPAPSYYSAFESASAFASLKHVHKPHKEISDGNK